MPANMMRVLILGGGGMLGHKLWQVFRDKFDSWVTVRSSYEQYAHYGFFNSERMIGGVDALNFDTVIRAFAIAQPDVVVNAIGIIKQLPMAKDPITSLTINSLFPHRLADLCRATGARLIHMSTDCVFSGQKGMYTEDDVADATDLYGRSKLLGEVSEAHCLTIRTSIIGRELNSRNGLVEWFLGCRGQKVKGYVNAIFSGFPTLTFAHILADIITKHKDLSGIYHVSSEPINKYELLCLLKDVYQVDVEIEPFADFHCDRSLDSSRFRAATGFAPPSWPEMVQAMALDQTPYNEWRS
jgi:dTDP-4-dehydrorhamnose reductase